LIDFGIYIVSCCFYFVRFQSLFIGFGGVVERQKVRDNADWFVRSFDPLIDALTQ
jgi:hypothetical protein